MNQIENIYFFVTLVSVIITILSLRYAITIKRYLERFTLVSKKVSNKELHARLNISVKGELGELTNNFNSMIENMSDTI